MQMFSVAYGEIAPVGRKAQQGCARTVLPGERKPVEEGAEAPACSQPTQESYLSCSLCCCLKPHQTLGLGHSAHTYIQGRAALRCRLPGGWHLMQAISSFPILMLMKLKIMAVTDGRVEREEGLWKRAVQCHLLY
ncbi:hypothetical protein Q8A67_022352 [Cirrhinus molitorella]|uniref:Uncharacterized protein n=1 Tax=Cirrhinus molitorella TaxID=172907 RepID=A0AA88P3W2_9TELE|nr:hypothetical protein Q8A67_022352 [Cirrhinus molitorella]